MANVAAALLQCLGLAVPPEYAAPAFSPCRAEPGVAHVDEQVVAHAPASGSAVCSTCRHIGRIPHTQARSGASYAHAKPAATPTQQGVEACIACALARRFAHIDHGAAPGRRRSDPGHPLAMSDRVGHTSNRARSAWCATIVSSPSCTSNHPADEWNHLLSGDIGGATS